ncbi:hypothetical protein SDC9_148592 [bioreactor metagenome]|uniref:Uncharacterized protein n=1 Tax=bioreactor metagenome TaxID=1076179 RepID=A0A645ELG8_9ZZZZ
MAEQFGLQQILGNRRRVDGDEGLVGAWAMPVQGASDQFLAGTGFTGDQHCRMRQRQAADGPENLLHGRRLTQNLRDQPLLFGRTILVH